MAQTVARRVKTPDGGEGGDRKRRVALGRRRDGGSGEGETDEGPAAVRGLAML